MQSPLDPESKNIIEQTLRRFLAEAYDPVGRHQRIGTAAIDYRLHWPALAELGILAMPFTEAAGGLSGSAVDTADVVRVLAGGLVLEPYVETAVIAGGVLAAGADTGRAAEAVAAIIGGECLTVLVGGRAVPRDALTWVADGTGFRVSGRLAVVPYAAQADRWLLVAYGAECGEARIFLVQPAELGVQVSDTRLMDSRPAAELIFDGVRVPASALWLEGEGASAALRAAALRTVNSLCADAVGVMEQLLAVTAEYLRTRVQFGTNIGAFQALQHRFADMHIGLLESRAIARALAQALDGEDGAGQDSLQRAAALVIERNARLIGHDAIQLHGGMGVTDELIVSHYNARLVVLTRMLRAWMPPLAGLPA